MTTDGTALGGIGAVTPSDPALAGAGLSVGITGVAAIAMSEKAPGARATAFTVRRRATGQSAAIRTAVSVARLAVRAAAPARPDQVVAALAGRPAPVEAVAPLVAAAPLVAVARLVAEEAGAEGVEVEREAGAEPLAGAEAQENADGQAGMPFILSARPAAPRCFCWTPNGGGNVGLGER
jgi:hypothetical protein